MSTQFSAQDPFFPGPEVHFSENDQCTKSESNSLHFWKNAAGMRSSIIAESVMRRNSLSVDVDTSREFSVAEHVALQCVPSGVLVFLAPEMRLEYCNPAARRLCGYSAAQWSRMTLPRFYRRFRPALEPVILADEKESSHDAQLIRSDGNAVPTRVTVQRSRAKQGVRRVVVVVRDVTERERVVAALRESEARFRHLADHAPALVWTTDPEGRRNYFNRPWLEFTGRDIETELRTPWSDGVHPDDVDRCEKTFRRLLVRRTEVSMQYRRKRRDGEWRWLRVNVAPHWDGARHFLGLVRTCTDVTDLLAAKHKAEISSEKLRLALLAAGLSPWQLNPSTGLVQTELASGELSAGTPLATWLGRIPDPSRDVMRAKLEAVLDTGVELAHEHRLVGRGRSSAHYRTVARQYIDRVHGETLVLGVSQDVTEQRELERRMLDVSAQEQRRIGGDLHDTVGQDLTGIGLLLAQCTAHARNVDPSLEKELREIVHHLQRTMESVRGLAFGLCPVGVDGGGLADSLRRLAARYETANTWRCSVQTAGSGDTKMDKDAATHVFMIAQEALANAVRHGHATEAKIRLDVGVSCVSLTIDDNGSGIAARPSKKPGIGLELMRYRARLLGGVLNIGPGDTQGTRVELVLPPLNVPRVDSGALLTVV